MYFADTWGELFYPLNQFEIPSPSIVLLAIQRRHYCCKSLFIVTGVNYITVFKLSFIRMHFGSVKVTNFFGGKRCSILDICLDFFYFLP